jgi:hypothetical protein
MGRDEAVKTVPSGRFCRDGHDIRRNPIEPWRSPLGVLGEHPLHVDAEVDRVVAGRSQPQQIFFRHYSVSLDNRVIFWMQRADPCSVPRLPARRNATGLGTVKSAIG